MLNTVLKTENELVSKCNQLKLKIKEVKHYNTDVVDIENILILIESFTNSRDDFLNYG